MTGILAPEARVTVDLGFSDLAISIVVAKGIEINNGFVALIFNTFLEQENHESIVLIISRIPWILNISATFSFESSVKILERPESQRRRRTTSQRQHKYTTTHICLQT